MEIGIECKFEGEVMITVTYFRIYCNIKECLPQYEQRSINGPNVSNLKLSKCCVELKGKLKLGFAILLAFFRVKISKRILKLNVIRRN